MSYAELSYAKLKNAELNYAKLDNAKLDNAKLDNAKLNYAEFPKNNIIINDRFDIHITEDYIKIGCQQQSYSWFKKLSFKKAEKEFSAGIWWKQWKPVVLAIYKSLQG